MVDCATSTRSKSGVSVELRRICLSMAPCELTDSVGLLVNENMWIRLWSLLTLSLFSLPSFLFMIQQSDTKNQQMSLCGQFENSVLG